MLTREQQDAVTSVANKIFIRAGAGTGKTEVLTRRVIHLLEQDPALCIKNFAIITFTNKATENVQNRLKQYIYHQWRKVSSLEEKERYRYELELLNSAQVSTIHSFCRSILELAGPFQIGDIDYAPGYRISEGVLYEALRVVIERYIEVSGGKKLAILDYLPLHVVKKEIINLYKKIHSNGIPFEKIREETEASILLDEQGYPKQIKQELLTILIDLDKEHQKQKINKLSTDDLLEYTYLLLNSNSSVVKRVQERFKHIFVDEFQDTSWFQTKILQLLCNSKEDAPSLFVVGDIKQAIYQFRGADLSSFIDVENWFKYEGEIITLKKNFRSVKPLVNYVNQMFKSIMINEQFPSFRAEDLIPHDQTVAETEDVVKFLYLDGLEDTERVADFIQEQISEGEEYKDFAILFRTNRNMAKYEEVFNNFGIPTQVIGAGNFYRKKEIIGIYHIINFLVTPEDPIKRVEAIESEFIKGCQSDIDKLITYLQDKLDLFSVSQILEEIFRFTKIRAYFGKYGRFQAIANLNKIKELTRSINNQESIQLTDFVDWLGKKIMMDKDEKQAEIIDSELNAVTLITVHKAKGLEFPYVILPDLNRNLTSKGLIPSVLFSNDTGIEFSFKHYYQSWTVTSSQYEKVKSNYLIDYLAEEVRVLYVALTRAEKKLFFIKYDEQKNSLKKQETYQRWLGEGVGELDRKRLDYRDDLEAILAKRNVKPNNNSKWRHQEEAKAEFLKVGNGILEMATGTGKTKTAIELLNHLVNSGEISSVIITVNGTDLLDQWSSEIVKGTRLKVYKNYENHKQIGSFHSFPEDAALIISRLSLKDALITLPLEIYRNALIICDEVHGLGSPALQKNLTGLIKPFKYRLGLSATPEREYDEDGNQFIEDEIGKVIYKFGLENAIQRGILCEFNYYPISYELTEEDRTTIKKIIGNFYARKKEGIPVSIDTLYSALARVRKQSGGKLAPFKAFIKENQHLLKRCIIFVETKEFGTYVQDIILPYINSYHTYYGEDHRSHLQKFSNEDLDCLITSKRISEGIDIRSVENIFLFTADRANLQTIQRIGRCLRSDPNNPNKRANVVDFIEQKDSLEIIKNDEIDKEILSSDEKRKQWLTELSEVKKEVSNIYE
jgi:DNA helicase II / ATP-dependent DNA helicase PcrA